MRRRSVVDDYRRSMAIATRISKMKPEEIVKQQSEMMAMTQAQTEFQQRASEVETSFNELEYGFQVSVW